MSTYDNGMESRYNTTKVVFTTERDKVSPNEVAQLAVKIGINNIKQIFSRNNDIIVNLISGFKPENLDHLEGAPLGADSRIKSIEYPGKKPKILITIAGLEYDTKDTVVLDYVKKIAKTEHQTIYRSKYRNGDLKGLFKGKRTTYINEFIQPEKIGSYHFIDGQQVRIFYAGMIQSCGWCYCPRVMCKNEAEFTECKKPGGT